MRLSLSLRPFERRPLFFALLAAVTEASPAVGVYWGNAGATHDPKFVIHTAAEQGIVPRMMLWTGVSIAHDGESRVSLLSLGMKQFFDLLAYVADRGKPLPEGDTVGHSEGERLPVRYVPSPTEPSERVWRVDLK